MQLPVACHNPMAQCGYFTLMGTYYWLAEIALARSPISRRGSRFASNLVSTFMEMDLSERSMIWRRNRSPNERQSWLFEAPFVAGPGDLQRRCSMDAMPEERNDDDLVPITDPL